MPQKPEVVFNVRGDRVSEKVKSKKLKRDREGGGLAHAAAIFKTRRVSGVDLRVNRDCDQGG